MAFASAFIVNRVQDHLDPVFLTSFAVIYSLTVTDVLLSIARLMRTMVRLSVFGP